MELTRGHSNIAQGLRTVREQVLLEEAGDRRDVHNVIAAVVNGWSVCT